MLDLPRLSDCRMFEAFSNARSIFIVSVIICTAVHHDSGLLVVTVIVAASLSIAALTSCEFVSYILVPGNNSTIENIPGGSGVTSATFGLMNYDPGSTGCRSYEKNARPGTMYRTARVGGMIAALAGVVSLLLVFIELICCRLACSRGILVLLLLAALICQSLTFLMFSTEVCLSTKNRAKYPCDIADGSIYSMIAVGLFLLASLVACPTPKPRPMIKTMMKRERNTENYDPCCYCWSSDYKRRRREEKMEEESKNEVGDEEIPPPAMPQSSQPPPPTYPDEIYAVRPSSHQSSYHPRYATPDADEIDSRSQQNYYSVPPRPLPPQQFIPPPPPPPPPQQQQYQQQYYAPQQRYFPAAPKTSFANAEVIEDDLFFDSKTV